MENYGWANKFKDDPRMIPLQGTFYEALSEDDKKILKIEEDFLRSEYSISHFSEEKLAKILQSKKKKTADDENLTQSQKGKRLVPREKTITRIPFYDILANPEYKALFEYQSVINQKELVQKEIENFNTTLMHRYSDLERIEA